MSSPVVAGNCSSSQKETLPAIDSLIPAFTKLRGDLMDTSIFPQLGIAEAGRKSLAFHLSASTLVDKLNSLQYCSAAAELSLLAQSSNPLADPSVEINQGETAARLKELEVRYSNVVKPVVQIDLGGSGLPDLLRTRTTDRISPEDTRDPSRFTSALVDAAKTLTTYVQPKSDSAVTAMAQFHSLVDQNFGLALRQIRENNILNTLERDTSELRVGLIKTIEETVNNLLENRVKLDNALNRDLITIKDGYPSNKNPNTTISNQTVPASDTMVKMAESIGLFRDSMNAYFKVRQ